MSRGYTGDIEALFDSLVEKYIKPEMKRYINMPAFRTDFIDATLKVLAKTLTLPHMDLDEYNETVGELVASIPFGFDNSDAVHESDFEPQQAIEEAIKKMKEDFLMLNK